MGVFGDFGGFWGIFGGFWGIFGGFWEIFGVFEGFWGEFLRDFGGFGKYLDLNLFLEGLRSHENLFLHTIQSYPFDAGGFLGFFRFFWLAF